MAINAPPLRLRTSSSLSLAPRRGVRRPRAKNNIFGTSYATLATERRGPVAVVTLDRPEMHNALDGSLTSELTAVLQGIEKDQAIRLLLLRGAGKNFCAGADLKWMRRVASLGKAELAAHARQGSKLLSTLAALSKPTIAWLHGRTSGLGVGLAACCDIAIAEQEASLALPEAKVGLLPTTAGAYILRAIGERNARRLFLTGERISAAEAHRIGLVHDVVPQVAIHKHLDEILLNLLSAGPRAQANAKALIRSIAHKPIDATVIADVTRFTATLLGSPEAREGIAAFLNKRPPPWTSKLPPLMGPTL